VLESRGADATDKGRMTSAAVQSCPRCRRPCAESEFVCGLCGELLRRRPQRSAKPVETVKVVEVEPTEAPHGASAREKFEPWIYLGLGALTAPVFALTPFVGYMGWFLASLVHEMGHAAFAWFCGMPAFPAIALDGHAAAMHGEQSLFLVLMIALAIGAVAWRCLRGVPRVVAFALLAFGYPGLVLSGAKEVLHLLAGHGAELAFATLSLWKTLDGGFTRSRAERLLYGTVGWFLLDKNLRLCWLLMHSEAARADYMSNGSFGMTNDYLRVAEDILYWRLESVALLMLVAALCVLPAAVFGWRLSRRLRTQYESA
jgi:hypothetical protein